MSASPSAPPGTTPNGTAALVRRRPKANPLVANQRGPRKPQPVQRPRPPLHAGPHTTGAAGPPRSTPTAQPDRISRPNGAAPFVERPRSPSPEGQLTVYPIFASRKDTLKDQRHHVARFASKDPLDITNQEQFKRPIYLHRRDPRANMDVNGMDVDSKEDLEAEQERLRIEEQKEKRAMQREENAKLIAPGIATKKKPQAFKKKVEQVYRTDETPEDRKRNQLRYEEALPWFLEEMDNKNVWTGNYESALSETHVLLMDRDDGPGYRLVPLEKWYRFRERNKFKHLDIEEAEKRMDGKTVVPRWFQNKVKKQQEEQIKQEAALKPRGLFTRGGGREEKEVKIEGEEYADRPEIAVDADDIDFNVDEQFDDDDENALFEGDDETQKLAEERIKRDQLNANIFGLTDEQVVDEEAEREKKLKLLQKQLEKGTRKALVKREKNFDFLSDSASNPYTEEVSYGFLAKY
jgi:transcription initiation factor TFIIF subunit alpha